MHRNHRPRYYARNARVLCCFATLLLSYPLANESMAGAGILGAVQSRVLFDPKYDRPAQGGSLGTLPPAQGALVVSPLTFNFTPVGDLLAMQSGTPAQQALAAKVVNGFIAAADVWRSYFADPITVNIDIDFAP